MSEHDLRAIKVKAAFIVIYLAGLVVIARGIG